VVAETAGRQAHQKISAEKNRGKRGQQITTRMGPGAESASLGAQPNIGEKGKVWGGPRNRGDANQKKLAANFLRDQTTLNTPRGSNHSDTNSNVCRQTEKGTGIATAAKSKKHPGKEPGNLLTGGGSIPKMSKERLLNAISREGKKEKTARQALKLTM